MTGLTTLQIALSTAARSHDQLTVLAHILRRRPPRSLQAVETALIEHLADIEDALAHVRRMQTIEQRDAA